MSRTSIITPEKFATFGELLRFLRRKADLTQRELAIAVGYSESQISRLEKNERAPEEATLAARFVPALYIDDEPQWVARLLELGAATHTHTSDDDSLQPIAEAKPTPHNLPFQLTSFIGREKEITEIKGLLTKREGSVRLLTITGPGGCGKTRLALQAASGLLDDFRDGVWLIEFAPLADSLLVPQTVAAILGLKEEPGRPLLSTLTDHLHGKRILLILDNCEHLVEANAQLTDALLHACPDVHILATSREMLGVAGERALYLPSLPIPDTQAATSTEVALQNDAVRLFIERAQTITPQFALTNENVSAVVRVCQRLDGIPLAIELAAGRLKLLPVQQIADYIDDAFRLLTGGSRTAMLRHQTLQALMDWSYNLLTEPEQALFRRLAVFAGGWSLEATETVGAGEGLDLLARLVEKSLVLAEAQGGIARYRLLETVRQYALAKLVASGEADEVRRRHAAYYLGLAEAGSPFLDIQRHPTWFDQMELEHDNLRAALTWSTLAPGAAELALRLTNILTTFWYYHGYWSEERGWLESALAHPEAANYLHLQAHARENLGTVLAFLGDYEAGQAHVTHSLKLFQELGDRPNIAWSLHWLGWVARERGDATTACARLEECVALFRELGDKSLICNSTNTLAEAIILQGDIVLAKAVLEENLALARTVGHVDTIGWTLNHLGHVAQLQGEYPRAIRLHEESLLLFRQVGVRNEGTIWAHQSLGETRLAQGDAAPAIMQFTEALISCQDLGDRPGTAWCLAGLAGVAALNEEPERAAWLWGAAEALRQSIGARPAPAAHATHERLQDMVRKQIGEAAFNAKWAEGQAASVEQAIDEATR
jgi:predicted ATPase/DNA-binding XRE family transcriptional regulator